MAAPLLNPPCTWRILIVEDDAQLARLFEAILSDDGYLVTIVGTGRAAFSAVSDCDYHTAIVDMSLPDMEGAMVIRHICSERPYMKVLAVSGMMTDAMRIIAYEAGATATLGKPMGQKQFRAAVYHLIDPSDQWMSLHA